MAAAVKWMRARKFLAVLSYRVAIARYCLSLQLEVLHEAARLVQFLVVEAVNLSIALALQRPEKLPCGHEALDAPTRMHAVPLACIVVNQESHRHAGLHDARHVFLRTASSIAVT
jgi:hypothetical protein